MVHVSRPKTEQGEPAQRQAHVLIADAALNSRPVPEGRVRALLERGDMQVEGLLPWSSNYTFLVTISDESLKCLAVYKPCGGERPLWDFPAGTLCRREVAAYLVARALGWPLVPPTVLRDGPHGPGAVQLYIAADPDDHYFTFREQHQDELRAIAAFDYVVNNADRKAGHCLRDAEGRIWVIDHGICFHTDHKLRTVIWDFAGQPVPDSLLADLRGLQAQLAGDTSLRRALSGLLAPREVEALRKRLDRLLQTRTYPHPGPGRSVPWPAV